MAWLHCPVLARGAQSSPGLGVAARPMPGLGRGRGDPPLTGLFSSHPPPTHPLDFSPGKSLGGHAGPISSAPTSASFQPSGHWGQRAAGAVFV